MFILQEAQSIIIDINGTAGQIVSCQTEIFLFPVHKAVINAKQ